MTPAPSRARLHSSELLRVLSAQGLLDPAVDAGDVGQRLGDWLHVRDAIALQGFLDEVDLAHALTAPPTARVDANVLRQRFAQVRDALEQAITTGSAPGPGMARIEPPATELAPPIDPKTAFDPWRRFGNAHQRQMESTLRSLRLQLRGMLAKGTTPQRQLATLDAIFEKVLQERETRLLGIITAGFEKRFAQALQAHMHQLIAAAEADESAPRTSPWLAPLLEDLRESLLAELDLRLQPVLGLIEALSRDTSPSP